MKFLPAVGYALDVLLHVLFTAVGCALSFLLHVFDPAVGDALFSPAVGPLFSYPLWVRSFLTRCGSALLTRCGSALLTRCGSALWSSITLFWTSLAAVSVILRVVQDLSLCLQASCLGIIQSSGTVWFAESAGVGAAVGCLTPSCASRPA